MDAWVLPVWTGKFSVGDAEMYEQHKRLLDLCRRAVECLKIDDGRYKLIEAREILDELADYVRLHFRSEEALMQAHGYADFARHKEAHALYEMKLETLLSEAADGTLDIGEFIHYLADWWSEHILVMDRAYTACLTDAKP